MPDTTPSASASLAPAPPKKKWPTVRNPYAKKSVPTIASASLRTTKSSPLHSKLSGKGYGYGYGNGNGNGIQSYLTSNKNPKHSSLSSAFKKSSVPAVRTAAASSEPPPSGAPTPATATTHTPTPPRNAVAHLTTNVGFNLPIADRLPSRNVSFSSAEIITISEASHLLLKRHGGGGDNEHDGGDNVPEHTHENDSAKRNSGAPAEAVPRNNTPSESKSPKSIRVTGVVLYLDNANQYLMLGDPLASLKPPSRIVRRPQSSSSPHSNTATSSNPQMTTATATTRTTNTTTINTPMNKPSSLPTGGDGGSSNGIAAAGGEGTSPISSLKQLKQTPKQQTPKPILKMTPATRPPPSNSLVRLTGSKKRKLVTAPKPLYNSLLQRSSSKRTVLVTRRKTPTRSMTTSSSTVGYGIRTSSSTSRGGTVQSSFLKGNKNYHSHSPRRSSNTEFMTKSQEMMRFLQEHVRNESPLVICDFSNLQTLDGCKVGDLAMIMGEMECHSWNHDVQHGGTSGSVSAREKETRRVMKSMNVQEVVECWGNSNKQFHCKGKISTTTSSSTNTTTRTVVPSGSIQGCGFLKARIIRNSNGTDMNLYHQALNMRRHFLKQQVNLGLTCNSDRDNQRGCWNM